MILALLAACAIEGADTGGSCVREPPLDYDNFGRGYLGKHCTGCHSSLLREDQRNGAPLGVDFDTYEGVLTWAERIQARATGESPTMPPGGGPTGEERALLAEWLACGVLADKAALE